MRSKAWLWKQTEQKGNVQIYYDGAKKCKNSAIDNIGWKEMAVSIEI